MPMIYKRFTEKAAEEWRQIYKALQLMEFLVKNGSERVIDDARSHLSLLKMLRQFHYIDQNGKDQGINVRNRSKELVDLLSDVERIRSERKKARATRNKYSGHEGGSGGIGMGGASSGSRYGGFGSETAVGGAGYGGSTRNVYGDGGGFGGESHEEYDEGGGAGVDRFDEYDEFDDGGAVASPARRRAEPTPTARRSAKKAEPAKPKEPEVDLFDFGDEPAASHGAASSSILTPPPATTLPATTAAPAADDEFDDFQSAATPSVSSPQPNYTSLPASTGTTHFAQPTPQPAAQQAGFNNIFSTTSPPPSSTATPSNASFSSFSSSKPSGYQPAGPNYFQSVQIPGGQQTTPSAGSGVASPPAGLIGGGAKKPATGGGDAFAGLLSSSGIKKGGAGQQKGLTMADMAKQKSQAGMYGANAAPPSVTGNGVKGKAAGGSAMDDLMG